MSRLLEIGGTNAVLATLLAVAVWAIARHWRQPAFVHLLWVLVLVKLITPPLVQIPRWSATEAPASESRVVAAGNVLGKSTAKQIVAANNALADEDETLAVDIAMTSPPPVLKLANIPWTVFISTLWIAGSAVWLAVAVGRLARFHFALASASLPSDELRLLAANVAAKVGVHHYRIRVTKGRLSPLVWPIGRPTVVIPQNLLNALTDPELQAIVTHEFAHLRRKDHWVRWLELVVTAVYWWHPVVWYARRQIQQSEERACDAWVVRSNPTTANAYANALFQAVECATGALRPAPVLASRVTSGGDLRERIENVINAKWNAELSTRSRWSVWLLAMCILPLSLTSVYASEAETATLNDGLAMPAQAGPPTNQGNLPANIQGRKIVAPELDDAAVLRDQVNFLDQQFKRIDALYKVGSPGGTVDRWSMAGFELAKARGELALVESQRSEAANQYAKAEEFAGTALKATSAAYQADRVTLDALLQASNNLTDIRRRLIQVRRAQASAPGDPTAESIEADLRRALEEQSSSESSTPSLAYCRKAIEQQKLNVERLQALADKQVVSASELARAKAEYELFVEGWRQAERKLESRLLLVKLAEVEHEQAVEENKRSPSAATELEVRRKKLMVDLAEAKVRELRE